MAGVGGKKPSERPWQRRTPFATAWLEMLGRSGAEDAVRLRLLKLSLCLGHFGSHCDGLGRFEE